MTEEQAKRSCIAFRREHDKRAKEEYEEKSCGFCFTEDCSCNGYHEECECSCCEDTTNKLTNGFQSWPYETWRKIRRAYLDGSVWPEKQHTYKRMGFCPACKTMLGCDFSV